MGYTLVVTKKRMLWRRDNCKGRSRMSMEMRITQEINAQDENAIYQGLFQYNLSKIESKAPKDLGIYLYNEAEQITAGLIGNTRGNWLSVKYLWVSEELRGQGIGKQILLKAEETAKERGCKYVFLDTFSFQAPEFYKKFGYCEVFVLENYPITGKRHYFTKEL